jgi:hypothetical protein
MDYSKFQEEEDSTKLMDQLACAGNSCDVTMIPSDKKSD